jgi:hypothetical protein
MCKLDSCDLGYDPVAGSCQHGTELTDPTKRQGKSLTSWVKSFSRTLQLGFSS